MNRSVSKTGSFFSVQEMVLDMDTVMSIVKVAKRVGSGSVRDAIKAICIFIGVVGIVIAMSESESEDEEMLKLK